MPPPEGQHGEEAANAPAAERLLKPVSIWREEKATHLASTSRWFAFGTPGDDLLIADSHIDEYTHLIKSQMKITNHKWEVAQQTLVAEGKPRSYQLDEMWKGKFVDTYLSAARRMMLSEEWWDPIQDKTEVKQLQIFTVCSRMTSSAYQLQHVRHRWFPYATAAATWDPVASDRLKAAKSCETDEYTEDWAAHYGPQPLSKGTAKAELNGVRRFAEVTSNSTERLHSENERRSRFRVWSHQQDLTTLSAWFTTRRCSKANIEVLPVSVHGPLDVEAELRAVMAEEAPIPLPDAPRRPAARGFGSDRVWGWNAFRNIEGEGVWMAGPAGRLLTQRWHSLPDDERQHFIDIGTAYRDLARTDRSGMRATRRRPQRAETLQLAIDGGVGDADVLAVPDAEGGVIVSADVVAQRLQRVTENCIILADAAAARDDARDAEEGEDGLQTIALYESS